MQCEILDGSWPAWDKFRAHGINRVYVSAQEKNLAELTAGIRSQHFEAGIYRDRVWTPSLSPREYAVLASQDLARAASDNKQCAYLHNLEIHDSNWVLDALLYWRDPQVGDRPTRMTGWAFEAMQGGMHSPVLHRVQDELNVTLFYECYIQDPPIPVAPDIVALDLVNWGANPKKMKAIYLSNNLHELWDGIAFTDSALPTPTPTP